MRAFGQGAPAWRVRWVEPGSAADALEPASESDCPWLPAVVSGSVAATPGCAHVAAEADRLAWWWHRRIHLPEPAAAGGGPAGYELRWDRVTTNATYYLDDEPVARSDNAFRRGRLALAAQPGWHDLRVRIAPLAEIPVPRRPAPRWRSALIPDRSLRFRRTPLLGRIPTWHGALPPVGILGDCTVVPAELPIVTQVRAELDPDGIGRIEIDLAERLDSPASRLAIRIDDGPADAQWLTDRRCRIRIASAKAWYPHTHGPAATYRLRVEDRVVQQTVLDRRVGFAAIEADRQDGRFALRVNGRPVFVRGACWTPPDPRGWRAEADAIATDLESLTRAGINLVRVCGTDTYADDAMLDLAAERGVLVWQDIPLATLDPPDTPQWLADIAAELRDRLSGFQARPNVAVVCGGTETLQQPTLMGVAPGDLTIPVIEEVIPRLVAEVLPGIVHVPSSPSEGPLPTSLRHGVSHYFGVGAYLRGLEDLIASQVSFASEALAFAIPPERQALLARFDTATPVEDDAWLRAIPSDRGVTWTFQDVTDHYVRRFFAAIPAASEERLDLRRAAVTHAIATSFATWRSELTPTAGAIVLSHRDLCPGSGWGLIDSDGRPKAPLLGMADVCAPRAILPVDLGLDGLHLQVVDDSREGPPEGTLDVKVFTDSGSPALHILIDLVDHGPAPIRLEALTGFRDLTWAWRFGPANYALLRAVWRGDQAECLASLTWPLGPLERFLERTEPAETGLVACHTIDRAGLAVRVSATQPELFVHIDAPGWVPIDGWFHLAPGQTRLVRARRDPLEDATSQPGLVAVRSLGRSPRSSVGT